MNRNIASYLALGVAILSLGISPILVRLAQASGTVSMFYRMSVALVFLAWPFFQGVNKKSSISKKGIGLAVLGGMFFFGDVYFWANGVMIGGATYPTLMANTAPIWVSLGAMIFLREKVPAKFWLGLVLAIAGGAIVMGFERIQTAELNWGAFFGLVAAVFYGGYFLITQLGRSRLDSLTYLWVSSLSTSVILLVFCLIFQQPLTGYTLYTYLMFVAMGVGVQVAGYLSVTYAQGFLPASVVSTTLLIQPVVTALLAAWTLGEKFMALQLVGGATIMTGVIIVNMASPAKKLIEE